MFFYFIKFHQIFLKGQCGSAHIVADSSFSKDVWNRNKTQDFWWKFINNPCDDNMGQTSLSFEGW